MYIQQLNPAGSYKYQILIVQENRYVFNGRQEIVQFKMAKVPILQVVLLFRMEF